MVIGTPANRQDGRLKVTGAATYSAEFDIPNCAHGALVLSPVSSGRVRNIDLSAVEHLPGILTVLTHQNMPKLKPLNPTIAMDVGTIPGENRLPMQDDLITYNGQLVAFVVADTLERARYAAELIKVDIEPTAPILDMHAVKQSGQQSSELKPQMGTIVKPGKFFGMEDAQVVRGNPQAAMAGAPQKLEAEYTTPHEHHNPIEMHAIIAVWKGDELTAYISSQSTKGPQRILAYAFGLPDAKVRAVSHFIGGGFGCKGVGAWSHDIASAAAARRIGRPVKLVVRRQEMFTSVGHRGATDQHIGIGTDSSGKIVAMHHACLTDAHPNNGFFEPPALGTSKILYASPNYSMSHEAAQVNIAPPIFMRAPGECPGTWGIESAMDEMAHQLGLDPIAFRLLNYADVHPQENKPWSSKHLKDCYARGQQLIGWSGRKMEPRQNQQGRYFIGYGMATATYPGYRQPAAAKVRIYADGRAVASSSGCDIGTGAYTAFRQVAADALGYPLHRVRMELGDSDHPFAPVAGGSQLTASVAPAVHEACEQAKVEIAQLALKDSKSPLHGHKIGEIVFRRGSAMLKSNSHVGEPLAAIVGRSGKPYFETCVRAETMMSAKGSQGLKQSRHAPCTPRMPSPETDSDHDKYAFQSFGAQFCRLRVDEELGAVRVLNWATVLDVGRVLNPKTARSQILGGVAFGIGMALMEETLYHPTGTGAGRPVIRNLADYHIASHADVPTPDVEFLNIPDPHINALGARGMGEIGITGCAAALANAVFNATGKRVRDLPITPEKVMA